VRFWREGIVNRDSCINVSGKEQQDAVFFTGGDKLTVTVERIDGGKLRCTGATGSDAVVIYPGEILAFQNIERQAHALRAPAPSSVVKAPPSGAISTRMISRGDKVTVTVERIDGGKLRCTGATWSDAVVIYPGGPVRKISGPFPTGGQHPDLGEDDFEAPPRRHPDLGPLPTRWFRGPPTRGGWHPLISVG
jgi:hypothetical protein